MYITLLHDDRLIYCSRCWMMRFAVYRIRGGTRVRPSHFGLTLRYGQRAQTL